MVPIARLAPLRHVREGYHAGAERASGPADYKGNRLLAASCGSRSAGYAVRSGIRPPQPGFNRDGAAVEPGITSKIRVPSAWHQGCCWLAPGPFRQ